MDMTKRNDTDGNKLVKVIKAEFDVEYIGGVGFCGPRWQEAQAAYEAASRKGVA